MSLNLTSIWILSLESDTLSLHTSLADPVSESHLLSQADKIICCSSEGSNYMIIKYFHDFL